jgi:outer membrane receptor protein involved in Fe transport
MFFANFFLKVCFLFLKGGFMFKKLLLVAAILCVAGLGMAQTTQTGNIIGTVSSSEGPLPGVAVTIKSPAMILPSQTITTSAQGNFRFMGLAPGTYEVTFELQGMTTVVRKGVVVSVAQTATIDITMEQKTLEESVTVIGQSPTVDKQRTTRAANMDRIFLQSIPAQRNLATYFNMAPGVTGDTAHGGSTMDNSYNLDGVNMVDPATGVPNVNFGLDIMDELAVQIGGLTAEYGSVRGAVVNVVTKSGGNKFSGTASVYYNSENLKADNTQGTPLAGSKSGNKLEYEPVVTLGGPIIKDKLWFFMNGSFDHAEQFVAGYPADKPAGQEKPYTNFYPYPYVKLSFQPGANDKFTLSYNYSDRRTDDRGASKFAYESVTQKQITPTHVLNAQWTKFFSSSFFVNLRYGMVLFKMNLDGKGGEAQQYYAWNGISAGNSWRNADHYERNRYQVNADATAFIDNLAGTHELKFGGEVQLARTTWLVHGVADPITGGCYNIYLAPGYYYETLVLKNGGFDRKDWVNDYAAFVQDNWALTRNVNLSLGLRFEYNSVVYPKQNADEGPIVFQGKTYNRSITETKVMFNWWNLAPRVGLIYDPFSDGKTLFKASFARYILPNQVGWINLSHPNGWFGYYQFLNPDGTPIPDYTVPWAMPGGYQNGGAVIGYTAADGTKYDLKAAYTDEVTIGIEKELWADWSVGARYIRKWDRNQPNMVDAAQLDIDKLMSTGELDWSKNWTPVTTTDPYNGQTITFYRKGNLMNQEVYIINPPGANRDYDGFEFTLSKRYSSGVQLNISYVYAHSRGLITTTRTDESLGGAVAGFFQDPNAHTNALGDFPLERKHQLKIEGLVRGPVGVNLSWYFRYLSGTAATRIIRSDYVGLSGANALPQGYETIYAETRGSTFYPDFWQLDLRLQKDFRVSFISLSIFADCFNVFNRAFKTGMWLDSSRTTTYKYLQMTAINDPRIFQLGARIEF